MVTYCEYVLSVNSEVRSNCVQPPVSMFCFSPFSHTGCSHPHSTNPEDSIGNIEFCSRPESQVGYCTVGNPIIWGWFMALALGSPLFVGWNFVTLNHLGSSIL